jgi:thiopurine S-methyltransferase
MGEEWLDRWVKGRTGWHEPGGNAGLQAHWTASGGRVLVPLCGKTPDLAWLASRGHEVVGVELSEIAARGFFEDQALAYNVSRHRGQDRYEARDLPVTIVCGDYFDFRDEPFDGLYDRGAYVAIDPARRSDYASHTQTLLKSGAMRLIITLEYDQSVVAGPPFAAWPDDIEADWGTLDRVSDRDDIDTCPPKFLAAGLEEIREVVWRSG